MNSNRLALGLATVHASQKGKDSIQKKTTFLAKIKT